MVNFNILVGNRDADSAEYVIEDLYSGTINVNESGISDFTFTIPKTGYSRDLIQKTIYLSNADRVDEILWQGTVETWEENETALEVTLSARGPLLRDKQEFINTTQTDIFADDALEVATSAANEDFEIIRKDVDTRVKDTSPTNNGSNVDNITVENQVITNTTREFTKWEVYVKYNEPLSTSTVGISDSSGGADDSSTITIDGNSDPTTDFAHGGLETANPTSNPYTYIDIDATSTEIDYIVAFPTTSSQAYIFSEEFEGTKLENIQKFAEIAGYRFSPQSFNPYDTNTDRYITFPIGYEVEAPNWRILDITRSSDYTNYANQVTLRGDNSTEVTITDSDEVDTVGRTINRYVRRDDVTSSAQARAIARNILSNVVQNRGESGSLTTTLPESDSNSEDYDIDTIVGANTLIPVWGDSFKDGGSTGTNYLSFNEQSGIPRVENFSWYAGSEISRFTFDIYPELNEISNHPRYLISLDSNNAALKIRQDGALIFDEEGTTNTIISDSGAVSNEVTQTIYVEYDNVNKSIRVEVDGNFVMSGSFSNNITVDPDTLWLGNKRRGVNEYVEVDSGLQAHYSFDKNTYEYDGTATSFRSTVGYHLLDTIDGTETEGNEFSFNPPSESAYRDSLYFETSEGFSIQDKPEFDLGTGDASIAVSFSDIDKTGTSNDNLTVWQKGEAYSTNIGYSVYFDGSDLDLKLAISDGSTNSVYTLAVNGTDYTKSEWNHLVVNIDRDGSATTFINGTQVSQHDITEWTGVDITNSNTVDVGRRDFSDIVVSLDELRMYNKTLTENEIETLAQFTDDYRDDFVGGIDEFKWENSSGDTVIWNFDDSSTPNTAIGQYNGTIYGAEYGATYAPPREISYNIIGDVTSEVKFDISRRVDTELSQLQTDVENIKR